MARVPWWVWVSGLPMGLGSWTPIVPGTRARRPAWVAWGVLWTVITVVGWALAAANDGGAGAGLLIILAWAGGVATTLSIREPYLERMTSGFELARDEALRRLEQRREAQRLARENPVLAVEIGVGRPDRPGAQHAGLVDVNNAPTAVLCSLPGIDDALATRIVELRAELNGFESVHDLGATLELDGNAVERLDDLVVFLPR